MEPYVRDNAVDEFSELDLEFHTRLAQICGNAALLRLWLSLSDMTPHQQRIAQQIPGIMKKSHYYHQGIFGIIFLLIVLFATDKGLFKRADFLPGARRRDSGSA